MGTSEFSKVFALWYCVYSFVCCKCDYVSPPQFLLSVCGPGTNPQRVLVLFKVKLIFLQTKLWSCLVKEGVWFTQRVRARS